jgi:hypothetical protein
MDLLCELIWGTLVIKPKYNPKHKEIKITQSLVLLSHIAKKIKAK